MSNTSLNFKLPGFRTLLTINNTLKTIIMKKLIVLFSLFVLVCFNAMSKNSVLDSIVPIRGFCISAPTPQYFDTFLKFIEEDLAPRKVNTLLLLVGYRYQYESHPELIDVNALSKQQVKQLVKLCREMNIKLIPQLQIMGHQSSMTTANMLLQKYPEFDETPHVKLLPERKWPNEQELYAKSYCPLHPEVHNIVYDCVDELLEVFETDIFHAGMDEIFYIADDKCPRCSGRDKAELFAGEVTKLYHHLNSKGNKLWIWGDRLIDGKTSGLGMGQAWIENTGRAINLIPKEVVICDWHYKVAVPTSVLFATNGFDVITCPYQTPSVASTQLEHFLSFKENSPEPMRNHFKGMMQTIWGSCDEFLDVFYEGAEEAERRKGSKDCFIQLFEEINELGNK